MDDKTKKNFELFQVFLNQFDSPASAVHLLQEVQHSLSSTSLDMLTHNTTTPPLHTDFPLPSIFPPFKNPAASTIPVESSSTFGAITPKSPILPATNSTDILIPPPPVQSSVFSKNKKAFLRKLKQSLIDESDFELANSREVNRSESEFCDFAAKGSVGNVVDSEKLESAQLHVDESEATTRAHSVGIVAKGAAFSSGTTKVPVKAVGVSVVQVSDPVVVLPISQNVKGKTKLSESSFSSRKVPSNSVKHSHPSKSVQKESSDVKKSSTAPTSKRKAVGEIPSTSKKQQAQRKDVAKDVETSHSSSHNAASAEEEADVDLQFTKAFSRKFLLEKGKIAFEHLAARVFKSGKRIDEISFKEFGMDVFLQERNLLSTVSFIKGYDAAVIKEFYANIYDKFSDSSNCMFGRVYIRGETYDFSPKKINKFFGLSCGESVLGKDDLVQCMLELTGGRIKKWSPKFAPSQLSWKYAVLHKLAISNWLPTSNTTTLTLEQSKLLYKIGKSLVFDLGAMMFQQLGRVPFKSSPTSILPFPNLIYAMLCDQGFITTTSAVITLDESPFIITPSLLTLDKFQDLPYIVSGAATKGDSSESSEPGLEEKESAAGDSSTQNVDTEDRMLSNISAHAVNNEILRVNEMLKHVDFLNRCLHDVKSTLISFRSCSSKGE